MRQALHSRPICAWTALIATGYLLIQYALVWLIASAWLFLDNGSNKSFPWMLLIDALHVLVAMLLCLVPLLKSAGWSLLGPNADEKPVPDMLPGLRWFKPYWLILQSFKDLCKDIFVYQELHQDWNPHGRQTALT